MNKLTAERCKKLIKELEYDRDRDWLTIRSGFYLQALQKALPVLEQQEREQGEKE